jgi:signal transduction histidine kinase
MTAASPAHDSPGEHEFPEEMVKNMLSVADKTASRSDPDEIEARHRCALQAAGHHPGGIPAEQSARRSSHEEAGQIISDARSEAEQIVTAARNRQAEQAGPELPCMSSYSDELPDGLVVADETGRVIVFNRAAARLTGLNSRDAISKLVFDALPLRDSLGRDWWAYTDPYHGLPTRTRHPERSLYLADGTEVLASVGYVRNRPPGQGARRPGSVQRLVICLRSARQRERLERSRAELVSTVAHELRSPLTSVKGFTATLLAKWGRFSDDQKRVMLEVINADADRVTRLITELLDVSRIESGRMEVHRQLVDLPDRARKIIAGRVAAGDAEDRFQLEVRSGLPETWLDADKIDQILGNLVENAVRHGAGVVTVIVEPAHLDDGTADMPAGEFRAHNAAAVSVRDQGEGIPPDLVPYVFRQFWRGKRRGGTGLGLYIVKGLVEAHDGMICVGRAPGGGAEFRFTVPAEPATTRVHRMVHRERPASPRQLIKSGQPEAWRM